MLTRLIYLILPAMLYPAALQDPPAKAQLDLGRKVYAGNPGGAMCVVCHGPAGKGIPGAGPDLTDATWIHGDGSAEFLRKIITEGVSAPKQSAMVMPPNGGGNLKRDQVDAVAAYVGSLSRK